jgi:exopolysaccharide biosynthesis polyprenyl glycosylphosphotransferase
MGLYESHRLEPASRELQSLIRASVAATVLLVSISQICHVETITLQADLIFLPTAFLSMAASHLLLRHVLKMLRVRGRNLRHLVVVGTNSRAVEFANSICTRPALGYRFVGFIDDGWFGPQSEPGVPCSTVSDIAGFKSYLRSHVIDEVALGLPIKSFYSQECELLRVCREQGVMVRIITDLFETTANATEINQLGNAPVLSFTTIPADNIWLIVKRAVDVIGSIALITLASPVMLIAFALVKLDSAGPALFSQERVGLNKRRFRIYKFRTMVVGAERLQVNLEASNEAQGPVFKIKRDPRITKIGCILRKTSIDELPQLFNVLLGEMSLVGPRPLPVRDYNGFNEDWQRRRFGVRPGITCLWQVSGRSSISFEQWMRLDMQYIDQWSLWLDFKILARTIPAVVRGAGAA